MLLPNGWIVYAPPSFTTKTGPDVDSDPGWIFSKDDSIKLTYDSRAHERNTTNCSFQDHFQEAQASINNGFYKTFYKVPYEHRAYIDTIDNKISVIVKSVKSGTGTVGIEILGCEYQPWLSITTENISAEKEKLVLRIFKTIRQTE